MLVMIKQVSFTSVVYCNVTVFLLYFSLLTSSHPSSSFSFSYSSSLSAFSPFSSASSSSSPSHTPLFTTTLTYFTVQEYKDPTEVIDLKVFSSVKSSEDTTLRTYSFDVYSPDMCFSLVAGSESEKEDWIRAIGRAIVISRTKSWQHEDEEDGAGGSAWVRRKYVRGPADVDTVG